MSGFGKRKRGLSPFSAFLRLQGVNVDLLPDVKVAPSALGEVMTRLRQGWTYIQV
jgi:intracellular sulfur oxidation DsrE/DsrF family protein